MNDFGEFLYTLRKEKGMTQAELAQLLGVTNKAVSKWETGEAMPETALLVPISRIFGVSVDELLNGKRSEQSVKEENADSIKAHLFTRGKDDKQTLSEKIGGALCAVVVFAGLITYFLLGIISGLWHPYWVIIPACALLSGIIGIIFDVCSAEKREAKIARGENPVVGAICGTGMLSCIIAYLLSGALANLWHPLWIIIVAGAFVCAVIATVAGIINHKRK
ncbi:MAG: helix-turn-helix domain-containing protein [Clostridia bacterium]|nr:helix-turn-helix domain-containing protein [Clostridia bacterium]